MIGVDETTEQSCMTVIDERDWCRGQRPKQAYLSPFTWYLRGCTV